MQQLPFDMTGIDLAGFALAGFAVTFSPGPTTIAMTAVGSAFGLSRAWAFLTGSAGGTIAVMLAVAAGLASLLLGNPPLATGFAILSAAYILYLALRIATAPPPRAASAGATPPGLVSGLILATTNPKAWLAIGALFGGATPPSTAHPADVVARAAIMAVLITLSHISWALAGASFARLLRQPLVSRIVNLILAALLVASMVMMLWPGRG